MAIQPCLPPPDMLPPTRPRCRNIFAGNNLLHSVMEQALKGTELGYNELNEYTHGLFGCVAKVRGPGAG
jgi:hypothetical protein